MIHKELYGGGLDTLVLLRASIAGIMFLLILLFIQFMKIKDLKSQRTILRGIFVGWTSVFIVLTIIKISSIYFILLTGISSLIILVTLFSLIDQIKEEKNTLTDKEIYLLPSSEGEALAIGENPQEIEKKPIAKKRNTINKKRARNPVLALCLVMLVGNSNTYLT